MVMDPNDINAALRYSAEQQFGVIDAKFLSQSVSILQPKPPHCVKGSDTVEFVLGELRKKKVGCVLVVDESGKLAGIFSERDCILKITDDLEKKKKQPVANFMTANPITQLPNSTIAYILNLMSQGGFRHIPIVDQDNVPIGIISVKDVVDYIVTSFTQDLLDFDVKT